MILAHFLAAVWLAKHRPVNLWYIPDMYKRSVQTVAWVSLVQMTGHFLVLHPTIEQLYIQYTEHPHLIHVILINKGQHNSSTAMKFTYLLIHILWLCCKTMLFISSIVN